MTCCVEKTKNKLIGKEGGRDKTRKRSCLFKNLQASQLNRQSANFAEPETTQQGNSAIVPMHPAGEKQSFNIVPIWEPSLGDTAPLVKTLALQLVTGTCRNGHERPSREGKNYSINCNPVQS
eukprot:6472533-Amphidinium_carterae.1